MKVCRGCAQPLPQGSFGKRSQSPDGLNSRCRTCWNAEELARYYRRRATEMRTCHLCGESKPVAEFVLYRNSCVTCRAVQQRCVTCRDVLPVESFTVDARRVTGRLSSCKPCVAARFRDPVVRAQQEKRRKMPHRKASRNEALRQKRKTDPSFAEQQRRAARERRHGVQRRDLAERDGWVCYLCRGPIPRDFVGVDIDHVVPRSRGGSNAPENLRATHNSCNRRKQAKLPEELIDG